VFGLFKKETQSKLRVMGHDLEVMSITRGGKILFTGEAAQKFPEDHFEGTMMEVALVCKSGTPYFAYYTCPDYYFAVAAPSVPSLTLLTCFREFHRVSSSLFSARRSRVRISSAVLVHLKGFGFALCRAR